MALQSSGAISISQIKAELGSSSNSLRTLSAAAGKSTPDAMSEFYGYSSYSPPTISGSGFSYTGNGSVSSPYDVTVTSFSYANELDPDFAVQRYDVNSAQPRFTIQQAGNYNIYFDLISASISGVRGDGNDTAFMFWQTYSFNFGAGSAGGFFGISAFDVLLSGNQFHSAYEPIGARNLTYSVGSYDGPYLYYYQYWDPITINNYRFKIWFEFLG